MDQTLKRSSLLILRGAAVTEKHLWILQMNVVMVTFFLLPHHRCTVSHNAGNIYGFMFLGVQCKEVQFFFFFFKCFCGTSGLYSTVRERQEIRTEKKQARHAARGCKAWRWTHSCRRRTVASICGPPVLTTALLGRPKKCSSLQMDWLSANVAPANLLLPWERHYFHNSLHL